MHQFLTAREIGLGKSEVGARLCQIGAHLVEHDLKRPVVDDKQEIAFFHHLPVGEMDLGQVSGHTRAHLDRIDGDEAADIFVLIDDGTLHRLGHSHESAAADRPIACCRPRPSHGRQQPAKQLKRRCRNHFKRGGARRRRLGDNHEVPRHVLWRPHHMRLPLSTAAEIVALPRPISKVPIYPIGLAPASQPKQANFRENNDLARCRLGRRPTRRSRSAHSSARGSGAA